jgi:hypothetical protein
MQAVGPGQGKTPRFAPIPDHWRFKAKKDPLISWFLFFGLITFAVLFFLFAFQGGGNKIPEQRLRVHGP